MNSIKLLAGVDGSGCIRTEIQVLGSAVYAGYTGTVAGDIAGEAPLLAQDVGEQHLVSGTRQTAVGVGVALVVGIFLVFVGRESVVGSHDTLHVGLLDTHLEGGKIVFSHVLLSNKRCGGLPAALIVVGSEVLGCCY